MASIKFFKNRTDGKLVRPRGQGFPTGLSVESQTQALTTIDYLVVAGGGGGGGGGNYSGGGGGGGFLTSTGYSLSIGSSYSITVGAGGPGIVSPTLVPGGAANGSYSLITDPANTAYFYSVGGGGGGNYGGGNSPNSGVAYFGGSGGGAGAASWTPGTGASGTPGQGNSGGNSLGAGDSGYGGGGGGAGEAGNTDGTSDGGDGSATTIAPSGTPTTYSGGGGGGRGRNISPYDVAPGGAGGGGAGGRSEAAPNPGWTPVAGQPGTNNTGGGGGGAGGSPGSGGNGGKGIVIIRYSGSQAAVGGTVSTAPGYTIHTFTGDGSFIPNSSLTYAIN